MYIANVGRASFKRWKESGMSTSDIRTSVVREGVSLDKLPNEPCSSVVSTPTGSESLKEKREYKVCFPNGNWCKGMLPLTWEEVSNLPHWKHCIAKLEYDQVYFSLRRNSYNDEEFHYTQGNRRSIQDFIRELNETRQRIENYERRVEQYAHSVQELRVSRETTRRNMIAFGKEAKIARPVNLAYTKEEVRRRLLTNPDILDVRFEGEEIPLSGELVQPREMVVTFLGSSLRSRYGITPIPPIQLRIGNGAIKGGPLCIHPHITPNDACYGGFVDHLRQISRGDGDVYAIVDLARVYRSSYDSHSELNTRWKSMAWKWWIRILSLGIPDEEPFMKPWYRTGMKVQESIAGGKVQRLDTVLGTISPHEMMTAIHIAIENQGVYSRARWADKLDGLKTYVPIVDSLVTASICSCGRRGASSSHLTLTDVACCCHRITDSAICRCSECGSLSIECYCSWSDRAAWVELESELEWACNYHQCDNHSSAHEGVYYGLQGGNIPDAYRGPWYVCDEHLPEVEEPEAGEEVQPELDASHIIR